MLKLKINDVIDDKTKVKDRILIKEKKTGKAKNIKEEVALEMNGNYYIAKVLKPLK